MSDTTNNASNAFAQTLNLPQTTFGLRANSAVKEPELLQRWEQDNLYRKATDLHKGSKQFILHDGPPYANGHLHMGHALTYILKDMVCKTKRMEGYHAPLVPGWDCHGLPIELKVSAELAKEGATLDPLAFKERCRAYVTQWAKVQEEELKGLGKIADYQNPYFTMAPSYESATLEALTQFVKDGYIERKNKTVPWCPSCATVLAAAEIEYEDRKDPSVTVLFHIAHEQAQTLFPFLYETMPDLHMSIAVWTTTPWTLPLNRAVALNPKSVYVVMQGKNPREAIVVAKERAASIAAQLGIAEYLYAEADAIVFDGIRVNNPCTDQTTPVILDDHVQTGDGTAALHVAPGCGPDDYLLGIKHHLEIYSPMGADGRYTAQINPEELIGKTVQEGQSWVLKTMEARGTLLHKTSITHSYPHCWRCHGGLIFRATKQWFCDLGKNDLVARSLAQIEKMEFVPAWGKSRLHAFVSNRTEWCISRQRQWGVPIPALLCNTCGKATLTEELVKVVAQGVAQEGIEYWDRVSVETLLQTLPASFACSGCGTKDLAHLDKEKDILDVWFDSGVSSFAVLAKNHSGVGLRVPADMYFEGSDQHRGWFQSSLLCGMVLYGHAPMHTIVTHGFIVDENKHKMSKSRGNGVVPQEVITKYSRDILRLWVASVDFESDVVISAKLLENIAETYRKIRNTCRFLISNLFDFDATADSLVLADLEPIDQYILAKLYTLDTAVRAAYGQYKFAHAVALLNAFCANDLSALYLDIVKDRLYTEAPHGPRRRAAQTTLHHLLDVLCKLMAPILSFTMEEVSDHYQKNKPHSVHLQRFATTINVWHQLAAPALEPLHIQNQGKQIRSELELARAWGTMEQLRACVNKAIEQQRTAGVIKHSLQAAVILAFDHQAVEHDALVVVQDMARATGKGLEELLADWCIVSHVTIAPDNKGLEQTALSWLQVRAQQAEGQKCPRCWKYSTAAQEGTGLCPRCANVLDR